mmetsp:Transcript_76878/g.135439  ORF Transcript_76878/g.135439 Transcript_76878/m.135439 type:complete len:432 (-) Transcript_76878:160-1455(-)
MGSGASAGESAGASQEVFIFLKAYKLGKKLGAGAFGQVRVAVEKSSGSEFAVKILDVSKQDLAERVLNSELDESAKAEVALWRQACQTPHENVVQLSTFYAERELYYLVCEKCKCTLTEMSVDDLTELNLLAIWRHMFSAIEHIHAMGVMHRDIKPTNFLWGGSSNNTLKLCDFGLAASIPKKGKLLNVNCGTAPFKAPELLNKRGYDESVDIWSAGVTAYLLAFGKLPYSAPDGGGKAAIEDAIKLGVPIDFEGRAASKAVEDFVRSLLKRNPSARWKASEVLLFPIFSDITEPVWHGSVKAPETLAQHVQVAAEITQQYKEMPDPTVQKSLDELLQKLADKNGGETLWQSMCFSEADGQDPHRDLSIFSNPPPEMRDSSWPQAKTARLHDMKSLANAYSQWKEEDEAEVSDSIRDVPDIMTRDNSTGHL